MACLCSQSLKLPDCLNPLGVLLNPRSPGSSDMSLAHPEGRDRKTDSSFKAPEVRRETATKSKSRDLSSSLDDAVQPHSCNTTHCSGKPVCGLHPRHEQARSSSPEAVWKLSPSSRRLTTDATRRRKLGVFGSCKRGLGLL